MSSNNQNNESIQQRAAPILNDDKKVYFLKQLLSTFLGGFKFSDEQSGLELSMGVYILQIFLYILFPLIILLIGLQDSNRDQGYVAGLICSILNVFLQLLVNFFRQSESIFFRELRKLVVVKPFFDILVGFCLSFLLAFTCELQISSTYNKENLARCTFWSILNCLFSFYSLVGESPSETGKVVGENSVFGFYSCVYSRPLYSILYLGCKFLFVDEKNYELVNIFFGLMPFLWFLGILGPFFVTFSFCIEKFNIWFLGRSPSASDLRNFLQFFIDFGFCLLIAVIAFKEENKQKIPEILIYLGSLHAIFLSSSNYLQTVSLNQAKFQEIFTSYKKFPFFLWLEKIIYFVVCIIAVNVSDSEKKNSSAENSLILVSFILMCLAKIFSQAQSAYFFGLLRSFDKTFPLSLNKFIHIVVVSLQLFTAAFISKNQIISYLQENSFSSFKHFIIPSTLLLRIFRYPLTDFQDSATIFLEYLVWNFFDSQLFYVAPFYQVLNRTASNLARRKNFWLYSLYTMIQDKKQRISHTKTFLCAEFTLLLPVNVFSIVFSSILDTPLLPFLGLPLFVPGFLRNKRNWHQCNHVVTPQGESLIYKKFLDNFSSQITKIANLNPAQWRTGRIFLLRIEKYLATFQILENSHGYVIITLRGLESQEMTSCHNHEANTIDGIIEKVFEKRELRWYNEFLSSIIPLRQVEVMGYEENNLKLTGLVEQEEFGQSFREVYLKLLVYFSNQLLDKKDELLLQQVGAVSDEYLEKLGKKYEDLYPQEWSQKIKLDLTRESGLVQVQIFKDYEAQENNQKQKQGKKQSQVQADTFMSNKQKAQEQENPKKQENLKKDNLALENDWLDLELQLGGKQNQTNGNIQNYQNPNPSQVVQTNKVNTRQSGGVAIQNANQKKIRNVFDEDDDQLEMVLNKTKDENKVQQQVLLSHEKEKEKGVKEKEIKQKQNKKDDLDDLLEELEENQNLGQKKPENFLEENKIQINNQNQNQKNENQKVKGQRVQELFGVKINNLQKEEGKKEGGNEYDFLEELEEKNEVQLKQSQVIKNGSQFQPNKKEWVLEEPQVSNHSQFTKNSSDNWITTPPIQKQPDLREQKKEQKEKKRNLEDELEDILEDLEKIPPPPPFQNQQSYLQNLKKTVAFLYAVSSNDLQFSNKQVDKRAIMESFRDCGELKKTSLGKIEKKLDKIYEIQIQAIRYAIKICTDWISINGSFEELSDEEILNEIQDNLSNTYIGLGSEKLWESKIHDNVQNLWSLHYNKQERTLSIYRSLFKNIKCTLFELNEDIVHSIWTNLQFELLYVTNDDDERYSIQTHKNFLRNIIIESAENPLGYAPFYSGPVLIKI